MTGRYRADPHVSHVARWIAVRGGGLKADRGMAELFLQRLDPVSACFSFRTFSDTVYTRKGSSDPLERAIHGSLDACWDELVRLNQEGAAISLTINQTNCQGRAASDIVRVRALFLDDDLGGEPGRFPLPPHLQVLTSPGHNHYYWFVEGMPLAAFTQSQKSLALRYLGDRRVFVLNQSMQLPGFWRRKSLARAFLPRVVILNEAPDYRAEELTMGLLGNGMPDAWRDGAENCHVGS